ncbi:hypothetical protein [Acinetobacter haemolyticus]|uniref:hypothetical protein n=1 Tax=Acinetobacter haemolyticus TaxID=29430 RepID=UPI001373693D|nr:hypothetical protein [Acinetobacter haemolyticus]NAR85838.1 inovirus-type Gp2 protein [Acinetobacter haemolyticus]NAR89844.1 inovirus-type Gp2 protein [Acinetobacter haemolyticus]
MILESNNSFNSLDSQLPAPSMIFPGVEIIDQYLFWGRIRYFEWFRPFIKLFDEPLNPNTEFFKDFALSVELKVFFKALSLMKSPPSLMGLGEQSYKPQHENIWKEKVECINELIYRIRDLLRNKENRSLIRARNKRIGKNLKSCRKLTGMLFEQYGDLSVLHIDLAIKPLMQDLGHNDLTDLKTAFHSHQNLELLKEKVAQLWGNRRHNHTLQHIVGRIWKFEHSIKKGFYVHAIFLIKSHPDHTFYLTCKSEITRQWLQITQNKGCTYDCNLALHPSVNTRHGLNNNTTVRENLMLSIEYRCKAQKFFIFKLLDSKEYRTLQKSQCPVFIAK